MTDKILIDRETVVQSLETLQRSPWKNWRVDRSIDSLTAALANAELVEDAARYRWIRLHYYVDTFRSPPRSDLSMFDAAIDAARAKGAKQ